VEELERLQNPDGGFPLMDRPGGPSSVDATCYILSQLRDLPPLAGSPMASRAVAFLRRSQGVDGSWEESPEAAAASPPWAQAADPRARAYLTAVAAYTLQVMDPAHADPIARASDWLRAALAGGPERAYSQTLFLAAAVWGRHLEPGAPERDRAYDLLERRELAAPELAWWLTTFVELGLEARYLALVLRQLRRLAGMQREDGGWPAEEGLAVESTLTALRVFRGFGLVGPS